MSRRKHILLFLLCCLTALCLCACNSTESSYNRAQELLAKGQYAEAAEQFAALGSYEDAATLTLYCRACALCESGDYETGIQALRNLGDYKDSRMRIDYYTARAWDDRSVNTTEFEQMEMAKNIYAANPLYLDSTARIAALDDRIAEAKQTVYDQAVSSGESGSYDAACAAFLRLGNYQDSAQRVQYYSIRAQEDALIVADQDQVIAVAGMYAGLGEYLDAPTRVEALVSRADSIAADKYAAIAASIASGQHQTAGMLLLAFGSYGSERVGEYYYMLAEACLAANQYDSASAYFSCAGSYSDAADRIDEPYYAQAEALLAVGREAEAIAVFQQISYYADADDRWRMIYYAQAERALAANDYDGASAAFVNAGSYSDAASRVLEPYYIQGENLLAANQEDDAIAAFRKASGYADADDRWRMIYYAQAERALAAKKYDSASSLFTRAGDYADARSRVPEPYYVQGQNMLALGRYDAAVTAFTKAGNYSDAPAMVTESKYQKAMSLYNAGQYKAAYNVLITLRGYKDVDGLLASDRHMQAEARAALEAKFTVGRHVSFGSYPQTSSSARQSPIEWLVIARDGDKALLISRYTLDCKPYHTARADVTWANCSLRTWLNSTFLTTAFSKEEQTAILTTVVHPDENPTYAYSTDPGAATQDKVFLLSCTEANTYFRNAEMRKTMPTAYAVSQGAPEKTNCLWWLRTPGMYQRNASDVNSSGNINPGGTAVNNTRSAVRPAIWVDITNPLFQ